MKTIEQLIDQVEKVDESAAEYLMNDAPNLNSYAVGGDDDELDNIMVWDETPQGHSYWEGIWNILKGAPND